MQCTGSEANLTKCSFLKLQYEQGKSLALQTSVAGVQCNFPTTTPLVCPTTQHTIIQRITTQSNCKVTVAPQVAPVRVGTGRQPMQTTAVVLLSLLSTILGTAVVALGVR